MTSPSAALSASMRPLIEINLNRDAIAAIDSAIRGFSEPFILTYDPAKDAEKPIARIEMRFELEKKYAKKLTEINKAFNERETDLEGHDYRKLIADANASVVQVMLNSGKDQEVIIQTLHEAWCRARPVTE